MPRTKKIHQKKITSLITKVTITGLSGVGMSRESAAGSLDDFRRSPDSALDAFGQRLLLGELGEEAAHESVAGAVGVDDLKKYIGLGSLHLLEKMP
jgi:hypothetical protein